MKVLIVYSSKTGNTEKIANVIHSYDPSFDILNLKDKEMLSECQLDQYELMFIGGWIDKGTFNKECLDFLKTVMHQQVVFFFTLGAYPSSKHAVDCIKNIEQLLASNHNTVLNHFHCQGGVDPKLMSFMTKMAIDAGREVDEYRIKRWENATKHPNQEDYDAVLTCVDTTIKMLRGNN